MVSRLLDDVVNRIVRLEDNEEVPAIQEVMKVAKSTIYLIQLNLDLRSFILGRPRGVLPYQEGVMSKSLWRWAIRNLTSAIECPGLP